MAEENFTRHFSRFYDEQKNSCIRYKGEIIKELFEGDINNLLTSYEWNGRREANLEIQFTRIDEIMKLNKVAASEIEQHNARSLKDWKARADSLEAKAFCMIAADKGGQIQVYSHFSNDLLAEQLRTVLNALEHGQKVIETELPKLN